MADACGLSSALECHHATKPWMDKCSNSTGALGMSRRWGEISEVRQMYKCGNDKGMVLDGSGASKKTKKARN